ncbi:hypothetical protein AAFF_G00411560 [Aldrovandia affinis]|uniref:Major facilitator superfamily (MFS) profile domain-containing protein n=1 Tax=Aldrovandia affinis TaxID=143900 RepID=A0AAD7SBB7_9TELE|nr:hypothetical protein AAFF_G00411560 [Aldrovandia affinis]
MAEEKTDFIWDILKTYDLGNLILAFCLSMLVGLLLGALVYILLTWLSRRRASAQITRRSRASFPRSPPHNRFGFFRHSGDPFGFYREQAAESPGHKPLFRATPFHSPLLIGQVPYQVENSDHAPIVSPSADAPAPRVPPVRLSSFRTERDLPRGPRSVQTPPPPYESVLLAFEEACTVPQVEAEKPKVDGINMEPNGVQEIASSVTDESPSGQTPRMSRQQVLTLISVASVNFSSMICYSILGPFFPYEAKKKGASQTVIGLIFGCYALCNLIGSLIFGKYIVQIGPKFMMISGLFVSSGCTILFGLLDRVPGTTEFIVLCFVIRSIDAAGFAAAMTSSFAISAKVFPNNIATVLGSLEIFTGLGLILGPPFGGLLYQSFGYEIPFIILGCFLFLMVPFNMYILPNFDATPTNESFLRLFTRPKIILICFVIFTISSGLGFLDATLSIFATEKFGLVPGYVGLLLLGVSLPYCLSSPLLGIVSDKFPSVRKWLLVLGGLGTAAGFCFLGPAPILHIQSKLWLLICMLTIIGFSLGMTGIPTFPEILNCAYENGFEEGLSTLGLVSGLFGAVWSIGMFFGPTFGGFVTQTLNFEWAAAIEGAIGFLASFLLGAYFLIEGLQTNRSSRVIGGETPEERAPLLGQSSPNSPEMQHQ